MSYYPPNAEGGAYGPPAGNANQNQGPPGYGAPAPQQGYSGYPPASMGHPGGYPVHGVYGQQGGYPAPGGYHAPPGNAPAFAYGAPVPFYPATAAHGSHYPGYGYPGAPNGSGYGPPMMHGQQGSYPAPGSYPVPAGNAHAYGAAAGSQFPDNRAPYSSAMQGMPGQQGGYPVPGGYHAYGAPAPVYPSGAAPIYHYPGYGYPGAPAGPLGPHSSNYGAPGGPAPAHAPPASGRPSGVTSPVPATASVGDMPPSLSGMSISAPAPGPPGPPGVGAYGGGLTTTEAGVPGAVPGTPVYASGGVYGNQTPNNMQGFNSDTNQSAQRTLPTGASGPRGNSDANMPAAAAVSVTEPNRCSCAPVEIPEEYEFISREGSLSLTEPPPSGSCGCHAAEPRAAASILEEYEVIPSTESVPVTEPPRGCSCGCHPAAAGSRSAGAVGDPAPTSLRISGTINILVMFVSGTTTDDNYVYVNTSQQTQVQSWWNYAKQFYKDRTRNLDININYQNLEINSSIKIPLVPPSEEEAEKNWRNPAVAQWLTAHGLVPSQAPTGAGLIDVNTLVEYTRDHGPDGNPGDWAFVCFITNMPYFAGQSSAYSAKQRVVQYYNFQMSEGYSSQKNQLAYTHEMAHVFGAKDEYKNPDPAPCNGNNGVPNNNAIECYNIDNYLKTNCLMNETGDPDGDKMCYYTRGQIGWPVMQPTQLLTAPFRYGVRKYGAMSSVSYDNKLWVFYATSGDNYLRYYNTTDLRIWEGGQLSNWKATQSAKSTGAVVFNDKLYLFFEPKDTNKIMYGIYDKNTQWTSNAYDLTGPVSAAVLAAVTGSYISAAVLGTSLYLFYERLSATKTISALRLVPSSAGNGTLTLFDSNVYTFAPSDFGLTTNDIRMGAVTVMRQTKKVSGVDVVTQKMVIAYSLNSVLPGLVIKPNGVTSCSFADGVSTIVGATWDYNLNGPQLQNTHPYVSLSMLAICSSNKDFGSYYLAGVDNISDDVGSVIRSSSTDLKYFAPAVNNTNYGFGGVATAVFNNTLITFSGRPGSQYSWYIWFEIGDGV